MKAETFFVRSGFDTSRRVRPMAIVTSATLLALLAIYWSTARSIYVIWERSDTFAHGFVIIPIVIWLLWRDRERLAQTPIRPCFVALIALAAAGFVWLAARLATVSVLSQFALLFMVQASIITLAGLEMTRRIAFPLAFLAFAIPFGEFLLPWLINRTGDATVALLKLSGVPVYREGNHLQLPSGPWSVVEACSGLRYLIAALVAGTIYAYIRYRSLAFRLAFIAAAITIPLVANWLRAYGIVMLAHHTGNRYGTNIDHFIYGWLFFGIVMALLFYFGSFWHEPPRTDLAAANASHVEPHAWKGHPSTPFVVAGVLCLAVSAVWPVMLRYLEAPKASTLPVLGGIEAANGWKVSSSEVAQWRPLFIGSSSAVSQQFEKNGRRVGLYIAYYRNQRADSKLVSTENVLVRNDDPNWRITFWETAQQATQAGTVRVPSVVATGRGQRLAIRQWYWVDGYYTGSPFIAATLILAAQLRGHGDDCAAIVTYTSLNDERANSSHALDTFASDTAQPLSRLLTTASSSSK
jgi:exosortase A